MKGCAVQAWGPQSQLSSAKSVHLEEVVRTGHWLLPCRVRPTSSTFSPTVYWRGHLFQLRKQRGMNNKWVCAQTEPCLVAWHCDPAVWQKQVKSIRCLLDITGSTADAGFGDCGRDKGQENCHSGSRNRKKWWLYGNQGRPEEGEHRKIFHE